MKLTNLTLPDQPGRFDIVLEGALISSITAYDSQSRPAGRDLGGRMVWSCPVDLHTHLDKGHSSPRCPNPNGSFMGALEAVDADQRLWTANDVHARMTFALEGAFVHGTRAIRTHLDTQGELAGITWPAFAQVKEEWTGRIHLQGVCLVPTELYSGAGGRDLARLITEHDGIFGGFPQISPDIDDQLLELFDLAGEFGRNIDLHVDETLDPGSDILARVAKAVRTTGFDRQVVCGHCCSLATQDEAVALSTLDSVAEAGIAIVSLPMCNLYLQDRAQGRTPRFRGVTLVHEARARGIAVAFGSDNTRDPFFAYGDLDPVELFRESVRIAHLDHPIEGWLSAITSTPAALMGIDHRLEPGAPADLIILEGRSYSEVLSRPQARRQVIRNGRLLDLTLPFHEQLDPIVGNPD